MPPEQNSSHTNSAATSPSSSSRHRDVPTPFNNLPAVYPQQLNSSRSSRSSTRSGRPSLSHSERRGSGHYPIGDLPTSGSERRSSTGHAIRTASPSSVGGSPTIITGDPHHHRTPSLGELHQELEQEQEAQVNRLLQTIRNQQLQLQQLQQQQHQHQHQPTGSQTAVAEDSTSSLERPVSVSPVHFFSPIASRQPLQFSPSLSNRHSSRSPSQTTSPRLQPLRYSPVELSRGVEGLELAPNAGEGLGRRGSRDECSFYHTEATMLTRENQMLKQRIRELERQIRETPASSTQPSLAGEEDLVPASNEENRAANTELG